MAEADLNSGEPLRDQISLGAPEDRRPRSLRRTSSLQASWPGGQQGPIAFVGTGRDLFTGDRPTDVRIVAEERADIELAPDKRITSIRADCARAEISGLAGLRTGGELRKAMAADLPDEISRSTLLHRILDDLGGATFMAAGAWVGWMGSREKYFEAAADQNPQLTRNVEGLCLSYAPGSPSMTPDGRSNQSISDLALGPLPFRDDDPMAWHAFAPGYGPNQWRIRHMDVWFEDKLVHAVAGFQDSSGLRDRPDERLLFHEYRLNAMFEPSSTVLRAIDVIPGVLPYRTCLAAPDTARHLIGQPLSGFGRIVPATLPGIAGCTHLNEVLRALQDLPRMAELLATELQSGQP